MREIYVEKERAAGNDESSRRCSRQLELQAALISGSRARDHRRPACQRAANAQSALVKSALLSIHGRSEIRLVGLFNCFF